MAKHLRMRAMNAMHFAFMMLLMVAFWFLSYAYIIGPVRVRSISLIVFLLYFGMSAFFYRVYNAYKVGLYRVGEIIYAITLSNFLSDGLLYVLACVLHLFFLPVLPMILLLITQTVISVVWCLWANKVYFMLFQPLKTLVVYAEDGDLDKLSEVAHFNHRFDVKGKLKNPKNVFAVIDQLQGYEAVFVSGVEATLRNGIVKACIDKDIQCVFIPHTGDVIISGAKHIQSFSIPIMKVRRVLLQPEYAIGKRLMDILFSALGLLVASPFMLITALAIKLNDGGPVFYRQVRLTKNGRRFHILKFRSMRVDAEKDGVACLASAKDDRITPVGKVIRACRMDELPQLINVMKGEMSIVGPRPERPELAAKYEEEMPAFSLRLQVKAGLTGMAQVYGKYNTNPRDKLKMDLMYINRMSFAEDLMLMFATVKVLFLPESTEGVDPGQVTALDYENEANRTEKWEKQSEHWAD